MNRNGQSVIIFGAVTLAYNNVIAHEHTVYEAHQQKDEASGGSDCGKGFSAENVTHHYGVDDIVQLLHELPEKKRRGKSNKLLCNGTFSHKNISLNLTYLNLLKNFLHKRAHSLLHRRNAVSMDFAQSFFEITVLFLYTLSLLKMYYSY